MATAIPNDGTTRITYDDHQAELANDVIRRAAKAEKKQQHENRCVGMKTWWWLIPFSVGTTLSIISLAISEAPNNCTNSIQSRNIASLALAVSATVLYLTPVISLCCCNSPNFERETHFIPCVEKIKACCGDAQFYTYCIFWTVVAGGGPFLKGIMDFMSCQP